jgi:FkbM family methyltransferase
MAPRLPTRVREPLKRAAFATGVGLPLRELRRRFDPPEVKRDRADNARLGRLLAEVLAPDSSCVDVGAHEGDVLADMVRLAPLGRHLAFEPLPAQAARLAARFPQVEVHEAALSDHAGEATFVHVRTRPGWSGLRERPYPGDEGIEHLTVRVDALDDALPPGFVPALVKIDVEGAEREVLAGAGQTLARHRPIVVFEHGLGSADHFGTEPRHLWELLVDGCGLEISGLDGDGPYTLSAFERVYARRERVNFVARPRGRRPPA